MRIFYIENYDFLFGDCRSFYFHSFTNQVLKKDKQVSLIKSTLHVSKGMLCLYDKQNSNTWLHVDMKFFFLCSTRHLSRYCILNQLQWIVFKEHSDWLLKFRKSFAIHLWATRAGFIVIVAGTNKAKSSFCAPLPILLVYAVLKQLLTSASAARGGYLLRSFVAREISTTITSTSQ